MQASPGLGRLAAARRLGAVCALASLLLGLTGCGSNFGAQTNQVYQPAVGVNSRDGEVYALNVLVVAEDGRGTLVAALLNRAPQEDSLVAVEAVADERSALETQLAAPLQLPPDQLVSLPSEAEVSVAGEDLGVGSVVEVTMRFANAAPISLYVPVVAHSGDYAQVPLPG